jgi:hypothetical protein
MGDNVYSFRDFTLLFGEDSIKSDPHITGVDIRLKDYCCSCVEKQIYYHYNE